MLVDSLTPLALSCCIRAIMLCSLSFVMPVNICCACALSAGCCPLAGEPLLAPLAMTDDMMADWPFR